MTLTKFLLLRYPFRTRLWNKLQANKICVAIWIAAAAVPVMHILVDGEDIIFDYRVYSCMYAHSSDIWKVLLPLTALLVVYIPITIIIVTTALLLRDVVKVARSNLKWQGIMTVVLTATTYTLSFLPYGVYCIAEPLVKKDPDIPSHFYTHYYRITWVLVSLNVLANFFIYSLTVSSFRSFLKTGIEEALSSFHRTQSSSGYS